MGGRDLGGRNFGSAVIDPVQALGMIRRIGVQVAGENPHPEDDTNPRLAGQLIGRDPVVAAGVLELLAELGLPTTDAGRRALQADAAIERAAREQRSKEPK